MIDKRNDRSKPMRWLLLAVGTISIVFGSIGILIPILPTTPFFLLAAACYARGSQKLYDKLMTNRPFGQYLNDYYEGRGLKIRAKVVALTFLWAMMLASVLFFVEYVWLDIVLLMIAAAVSVHVLTIRTCVR